VTSMPLVIFLLTNVIRPPPWDICHLPAQSDYERDRETGRCFPRWCKSARTFSGRPYTRFRAPRARQGSSRTQVSILPTPLQNTNNLSPGICRRALSITYGTG
jgi:hypothetical protein